MGLLVELDRDSTSEGEISREHAQLVQAFILKSVLVAFVLPFSFAQLLDLQPPRTRHSS